MITRNPRNSTTSDRSDHLELGILLATATVLSIYALVRYRGLWGEADTHDFTWSISSMLQTHLLVPGPGYHLYPNGYGYQALAIFLIDLGGINLSSFQLYGATLLMPWIVVPAWLLYRELTGTPRGATLATVILIAQPEFLFPILRGTHEKFTRGLMLCCLYLLMRSIRSHHRATRFAGLVLAFDLAAFAMNTFNNLFGTSFIAAIGLALVLSWVASRVDRSPMQPPDKVFRRLLYATGTSLILAIIFTLYVYQPARDDLLVLRNILDRVTTLLLNTRTAASNPYTVVSGGWVSLPVYFAVSVADWLLLATSAAIWLSQTFRWLLQRWHPEDPSVLLLWAFYGAFAFAGALSIAIDVSGALASNLQQRNYPSFAMVAVAVVARWLIENAPQRETIRRRLNAGAWATIGVLVILSTFKATNEPLLSNKWLFYQPSEMVAFDWANEYLKGRPLWDGFDERLSVAYQIRTQASAVNPLLDDGIPDPTVHDFLVTNVIRARALRLSSTVPVQADDLITFDDGTAQIYHRRPQTPFQR